MGFKGVETGGSMGMKGLGGVENSKHHLRFPLPKVRARRLAVSMSRVYRGDRLLRCLLVSVWLTVGSDCSGASSSNPSARMASMRSCSHGAGGGPSSRIWRGESACDRVPLICCRYTTTGCMGPLEAPRQANLNPHRERQATGSSILLPRCRCRDDLRVLTLRSWGLMNKTHTHTGC